VSTVSTQGVMDKMDKKGISFLAGYLLFATVLTSYMIYALWSGDIVNQAVHWRFFWMPQTISVDVQLLLLVLFTGAFGSCVYALKSLADYEGEDKLYANWFAFYVIQPFEGAGVAFLLYLLIRGGFLAGASGEVTTVNKFVVCGIAGLAGAFSDTALLKLREVFQTLFKPTDDRGGKIAFGITTSNLPDGTVGIAYKHTLRASGGIAPLTWSVTPSQLPADLNLDATTGEISGVPTEVSAKKTYRFTVKDSAKPPESTDTDLTLEIKSADSPKISTLARPDGVATSTTDRTLQTK